MSEDIKKGLLGIVVDETEVSKVMPEINSLTYRGYAAQDLCQYCRFEEVAYLILNKDLPNTIQLRKFEKEERGNRDLSKDLHPFQIAFFRASLGLIVLSPIIFKNRFAILRTSKIKLHALRGLLNAGAMLCFFYGLSITPLAQVTALSFAVPLFATLFAVLLLGEIIKIRRITALLIGFFGTLVIIRPGLIDFGLGPILILSQAIIWSLALMVIKVLTRTDSSLTIAIYASIFLSPMVLIAAIPVWQSPTVYQLILMLIIATFGTIAQTLMNESLKLGETSVVMPVEFTR